MGTENWCFHNLNASVEWVLIAEKQIQYSAVLNVSDVMAS